MKIIVQRENLVLWHLICFSVLLAFTACSDNKEEFQEYLTPASGSEAIFEQGFSFAEAASSQSVSFEAGYQWTAELSGEDIGWCSINPAKGLSGKATIMVSVAKNETGIARTAQLNIISGSKREEFIVRLPFRTQPENHRIEKIAELEGLKALVVDDDFNTCDSVTKMLVKVGMRSEWTLSGKEAVLRARQSMELGDAFHAYIIDWRLPDMNGIEVTRQIRSLGDDTPIIILTAYDWSDIEVEARAAGVTAFCAKPLFMSDIRDTLMAAIGQNQAEQENPVLPETSSDFRGRCILLVEDNELNREIAVEILNEYGFLVDTAENGAEAVEKVKNSKPGNYDLVLMDVQMPIMNGYEATRQIRALDDPALAGITILAMTANAFDEDRKEALECGMDGFLSKPIDIEELISILHAHLLD